MKEFSAQTGGRYTYVDDIVNLQELSLAFASIFDGCDNFIISGCNVQGNSISAGYVYINGKIRHFTGSSGVSAWPQVIYESNRAESVAYKSGSDKVGRVVYGCALATTLPASTDPITKAAPAFIKITEAGGLTIRDAFFGKYSLLLKSKSGKQQVHDAIQFNNDLKVAASLHLQNGLTINPSNSNCRFFYDGENLTIQSRVGEGTVYKFIVDNTKGFKFLVGDTLVCSIGDNAVEITKPVSAPSYTTSGAKVLGNELFATEQADTASLKINMTGDNQSVNHYRNTLIGNGKNKEIVSVLGSQGEVKVQGQISIQDTSSAPLQIIGSTTKDNVEYQKSVEWLGSDKTKMAHVGYAHNTNQNFEIKNTVGSISLTGVEYVDIAPIIKENGVLLSDRYVTKTLFNEELAKLANASNVYTSAKVDELFVKKDGGLTQLITAEHTQQKLREQIGAISTEDADKRYVQIANLLSDVATSESAKDTICQNIGAARSKEYQQKLKDTGWVQVVDKLYARQVGPLVYIQGKLKVRHSGDMFILPNQIDAPTHDVYWHYHTGEAYKIWSCKIPANKKTCSVWHCNSVCGHEIEFMFNYMI